ncbi:MAG: DNA-processing protein DprA, partial [Cyclobacteriaceae bacterium]
GRKKLFAIPGVGPATYALLHRKSEAFQQAEQILSNTEKTGIEILFHSDKKFPSRLRHIPDAPSLLYTKGPANLNHNRIMAIVGTRQSTSYGISFTRELIHQLKPYNPLIISGLAYGIDINAHRASLGCGLSTAAILAGGLDYIYPADHGRIAMQMTDQGALITEHPPGTAPEAHRFPARNRIIAGMADAVLVTEARIKGGALITARLANDYDREVFALPGPVDSPASAGCHNLIKRNQAHLVTSSRDIIEILDWEGDAAEKKSLIIEEENLPVTERRIYAYLTDESFSRSIDQISWSTNLTIHETATALLQLEFKGLVKSLPGKHYRAHQPKT